MTTADDRHEDVWAEAVAEQYAPPAAKPAAAEPAAEPASAEAAGPAHDEVAKKAEPAQPVKPAPSMSPADLFPTELSPLVDEVRKFAATVGEKVSSAQASISNGDSLGALQDLAAPLRVKHPEVYGHLIAAGGELLAAYRSAVSASEKRWTAPKPAPSEQIDLDEG